MRGLVVWVVDWALPISIGSTFAYMRNDRIGGARRVAMASFRRYPDANWLKSRAYVGGDRVQGVFRGVGDP